MQTLASQDLRSLLHFAVQRITLPLFNVHYVFETDLTQAETLPDPRRPLPPGVTIGIFRGEDEIGPLAERLTAAGLESATLKERMKRGDMVTAAFDGTGDVVAYTWTTFGTVWMREVRATLLLDRNETVGLDTFVLPRWRGRGLQYPLNAWKFRHLSEHGYERGLNWVNALNIRSMKSQSSQGKRKIATIYSSPILNIVRVRKALPGSSISIQKRTRWRSRAPVMH